MADPSSAAVGSLIDDEMNGNKAAYASEPLVEKFFFGGRTWFTKATNFADEIDHRHARARAGVDNCERLACTAP